MKSPKDTCTILFASTAWFALLSQQVRVSYASEGSGPRGVGLGLAGVGLEKCSGFVEKRNSRSTTRMAVDFEWLKREVGILSSEFCSTHSHTVHT